METSKLISIFKKRVFKWFVLIALALLGYSGYQFYKDVTMPSPLVFLIPESYFGPVFFFFDQPDGADVVPDPLGNAVWVPENGVVKLKAATKELMGRSTERHRATYMVSVSKDGSRKILKMFVGTYKNDDGTSWEGYFDENAKLHKFELQEKQIGGFSYLPHTMLNERMVFNHDGCRHQGFTPHTREVTERKMTDEEAGTPACGKFLVISPNEYIKMPNWLWEDVQRNYSSIKEFVNEANERVKKKKEFYKLP